MGQHGADKKVAQALKQLAKYGVAFVACNHGIHRSPSVGETAAEECRAQFGPCEARLASSRAEKTPTMCIVEACQVFSVVSLRMRWPNYFPWQVVHLGLEPTDARARAALDEVARWLMPDTSQLESQLDAELNAAVAAAEQAVAAERAVATPTVPVPKKKAMPRPTPKVQAMPRPTPKVPQPTPKVVALTPRERDEPPWRASSSASSAALPQRFTPEVLRVLDDHNVDVAARQALGLLAERSSDGRAAANDICWQLLKHTLKGHPVENASAFIMRCVENAYALSLGPA